MLNTKTTTHAVHKTAITYEAPATAPKDGGKAWLNEAFTFIKNARQVGALTVHFGVGGTVSSMTFEEKELIPQRNIELEDSTIKP